MAASVQRDPFFLNKALFVLILVLALMGLAYGSSEWRVWSDAQEPRVRPPGPTAVDYRLHFTTWVATLLVIPAFCFYILRRPVGTSSYWILFWTASYLAYLARC